MNDMGSFSDYTNTPVTPGRSLALGHAHLRQQQQAAKQSIMTVTNSSQRMSETENPRNRPRDRFLALCLAWRQYAANHHGHQLGVGYALGLRFVKGGRIRD